MANTTVRIDVSQGGDAARGMRDLTKATQDQVKATQLLTREQAALAARNQLVQQQNARMIEDARQQATGVSKAKEEAQKWAANEKYRAEVEREKQAMKPRTLGGQMRFGLGAAMGVAAGIGTVMHVADSTANMINAGNNPNIPESLRNRAMEESAPIIGGWLKTVGKFADAVSGATETLQRMRRAADERKATFQAYSEMRQGFIAANETQLTNVTLRNAQQDAALVGFKGGGFDRSTLKGERDYAIAEKQASLDLAEREARIGVSAAKENTAFADARIQEAEKNLRVKQKAYNRTNRAELDTPIAAEQRARDLEQRATEVIAARNELIDAQKAKVGAVTVEAEKQRALNSALLAQDQNRLAILQQQEQRIKGAAQGYGSMNAAERLGARQALEKFQKFGLEGISEQQRALISRAGGGEFLAKEFERSAEKDKGFRAFREGIGAEGDLGQIREQQAQIQAQITTRIQIDARQVQEELTKAVVAAMDEVRKQLALIQSAKVDQFSWQRLIGEFSGFGGG